MKINWPGWGRKTYRYPDGSYLALEWHRIGDEMYYWLYGVRNEIRRTVLEFRIPDNLWQGNEPSLYDESIADA